MGLKPLKRIVLELLLGAACVTAFILVIRGAFILVTLFGQVTDGFIEYCGPACGEWGYFGVGTYHLVDFMIIGGIALVIISIAILIVLIFPWYVGFRIIAMVEEIYYTRKSLVIIALLDAVHENRYMKRECPHFNSLDKNKKRVFLRWVEKELENLNEAGYEKLELTVELLTDFKKLKTHLVAFPLTCKPNEDARKMLAELTGMKPDDGTARDDSPGIPPPKEDMNY